MKIYQKLAISHCAHGNCVKSKNTHWEVNHYDQIQYIMHEIMPCGSGIDCGTKFNWTKSKIDRLILDVSFHHMDQHGGYCGWTEHQIAILPNLQHDFTLRISGENKNDIKEFLHEIYGQVLSEEYTITADV
jgi:hypothetical protein